MPSNIETEVNDLLKFVFSQPQNPGKKVMRAALKADWRPVVKTHCTLTATQIKWIDGLSDVQAKQMATEVMAVVGAGGVPKVRFVDNKTGGFAVARKANNVNNNKNNNVNGTVRLP
jgi:hypothetical protein